MEGDLREGNQEERGAVLREAAEPPAGLAEAEAVDRHAAGGRQGVEVHQNGGHLQAEAQVGEVEGEVRAHVRDLLAELRRLARQQQHQEGGQVQETGRAEAS